jgi:hypothetical protein
LIPFFCHTILMPLPVEKCKHYLTSPAGPSKYERSRPRQLLKAAGSVVEMREGGPFGEEVARLIEDDLSDLAPLLSPWLDSPID